MVEADKRMKTSGTGLSKPETMAFLAQVNAERLYSLKATDDTFRAMDLNGDGKISLIKFFLSVVRRCLSSFSLLLSPMLLTGTRSKCNHHLKSFVHQTKKRICATNALPRNNSPPPTRCDRAQCTHPSKPCGSNNHTHHHPFALKAIADCKVAADNAKALERKVWPNSQPMNICFHSRQTLSVHSLRRFRRTRTPSSPPHRPRWTRSKRFEPCKREAIVACKPKSFTDYAITCTGGGSGTDAADQPGDAEDSEKGQSYARARTYHTVSARTLCSGLPCSSKHTHS